MTRAIIVALLALTCGQTALADAVVRGVGTQSCAEFAKAYKGDPKYAELVYLSWAQGLMSGLNIQLSFENKPKRWSRFAGQAGGLAKVDSGLDYAANFSSFACVA